MGWTAASIGVAPSLELLEGRLLLSAAGLVDIEPLGPTTGTPETILFDPADTAKLGKHTAWALQNAQVRNVTSALAEEPGEHSAFDPTDFRVANSAYRATNSGSTGTIGDDIHSAADLRAALGVTGAGVKIGVISDGVDNWTKVSGSPHYDLPATIHVNPSIPGDGNEGVALLEIIHDLAPQAELYFSGPRYSWEMVDSIDWLVASGVDVIIDDVSFFDQPFFEDGPIAKAALRAVGSGVVYVTSAGNYAQTHFQGPYVPQGDDSDLHLFQVESVDNILRVQVPTGQNVRGALQWSDPWGASSNDYDLLLYGWTGTDWTLVAASAVTQDGNDAPFEFVSYTNTPGYSLLGWAINKASGVGRELEFYTFGGITAIDGDDIVAADSIFGHAAVGPVLSVAAVDSADSRNDTVEMFSSRGPSTIYTNFATQTSTRRNSLDVTAVDRVETKIGKLGYFFNPFFGTSASAPHVAGIAALLLEYDSSLSPADIHDLICDNAVDIMAPGYDADSGFGRLDAMSIITASPGVVDLASVSDTGASQYDNITSHNNSRPSEPLVFVVGRTIAGATVTLWDEAGNVLGTGTGTGGSVAITTTYELADGMHNITAIQILDGKLASSATDALSIVVDTTAPVVTVNAYTTGDTTPFLAGSVNEAATVEVTADGTTYGEVNGLDVANGRWMLPDNIVSPPLANGAYDLDVAATDLAGNVGFDTTEGELIISPTAPAPSPPPPPGQTVAEITLGGGPAGLRSVVYFDTDGTRVTLSIAGGRTGEAVLNFSSDSAIMWSGSDRRLVISAASGATLDSIELMRPTRGLTFRTRGGTVKGAAVSEITGDFTLGKLSGKHLDIVGEGVDMAGGAIRNINVRNIAADIFMGGQVDRGVSICVGRDIVSANITVTASNVRLLRVGRMIDSSLFVGFGGVDGSDADAVYDLPPLVGLTSGFAIKRITVRGYREADGDLFINSNIAADTIDRAMIKNAAFDNDGTPFGIAAGTLGRLTLRQGRTTYRFGANWPSADETIDLTVRVV